MVDVGPWKNYGRRASMQECCGGEVGSSSAGWHWRSQSLGRWTLGERKVGRRPRNISDRRYFPDLNELAPGWIRVSCWWDLPTLRGRGRDFSCVCDVINDDLGNRGHIDVEVKRTTHFFAHKSTSCNSRSCMRSIEDPPPHTAYGVAARSGAYM